jgi:hypothetical protein
MAKNSAPSLLMNSDNFKVGKLSNDQLTSIPCDGIRTTIEFTVRDPKHETEKPYDLRYDAGGAIPKTNTTNEAQSVIVKDFRAVLSSSNYADYGFCVEELSTPITEVVFERQDIVKDSYYPVIEDILRKRYPGASGVYILEHILRRRKSKLHAPRQGVQVEYTQPATLAHIDCSLESATKVVQSAFSISPDRCRHVVSINLWKSLQGSGNDWPLALCDMRTLDHARNTVVADVVYHNRFTENEFVYHDEVQDWWYVSDLKDDEIIMFLQKDSESETPGGGGKSSYRCYGKLSDGLIGVAHTSFLNPMAENHAKPRTSIEFRTFVVFA